MCLWGRVQAAALCVQPSAGAPLLEPPDGPAGKASSWAALLAVGPAPWTLIRQASGCTPGAQLSVFPPPGDLCGLFFHRLAQAPR